MIDVFDEIISLKADAKSSRDDGDWDAALIDLQEAIDRLLGLKAEASPPSTASRLSTEFADTYGLIGGVEKRWALQLAGEERRRHLEASLAAYDKGFSYERDLGPRNATTYNRVNRLVGRVLLDTGMLQNDSEFTEELRTAEEVIDHQINFEGRKKDPWAYSDLGTVRLLRGKPDALAAYRELEQLRPQRFVYDSTLSTLEPLCDLASNLRPDLVQAVAQLRRSAQHSK
jgi:tetratricopeptide (TPR) repeat protein